MTIARGYTLLEVLVVVTIIGVLAVLALPTYEQYVTRSKVAQGLAFADEVHTKVSEYYAANGYMPQTAMAAGLKSYAGVEPVSKLVWNLDATDPRHIGYIDVRMNLGSQGSDISAVWLEGKGRADGSVIWHCVSPRLGSGARLDAAYIPAVCRDGDGGGVHYANSAPHSSAQGSGQPAQRVCSAGSDKIMIPLSGGKTVSACVKSCGDSKQRDPQNLYQCVDKKVCPQASVMAADGSCKPTPVKQQPAVAKPVKQQPAVAKPGPTATEKAAAACGAGKVMGLDGSGCATPTSCLDATSGKYLVNPDGSGLVMLNGKPVLKQVANACRGPKFICERSHTSCTSSIGGGAKKGPRDFGGLKTVDYQDSGDCNAQYPIPVNIIENLKDGSRYVVRGCTSIKETKQSLIDNAADSRCANYNVVVLQDAHFVCVFACQGDNCNLETVPDNVLK